MTETPTIRPPPDRAPPDLIRVGARVSIRPRGKRKTYVAEFWHHGQHRRRSLKTANREHATRRALQIEAELATGHYAAPAPPVGVTAAKEEWLKAKADEGRSPKTASKYREWLDRFDEHAAAEGAHTLHQITPKLFDAFRSAARRGRSEKSAYDGLTIVKSFIKWASGGGRDYLPKNPLTGCKVPKPYVDPKRSPTRRAVLSILAAAAGARRRQYAILGYAGLRAGELQMLRPKDVDLQHGWIHVMGREGWQPKTRRARKAPIHPLLAERLKEYVATLPEGQPYLFCALPSRKYPNGGHHINVKRLNEDFQVLAKSLALPVGRKGDGLVVHSMRHFFETACVDSRIPQFVIDVWMGHAGHASMGRQYYGFSDGKSRRYMRKVKFVKGPKPGGQPGK